MASTEVNNNMGNLEKDIEAVQISDGKAVKKEAWGTERSLDEEVMFDPDLLSNVPSAIEVTSKNPDLLVRPLQANDFGRGFIDLLKQLTSVGSVSESDFKERFHLMKSCQSTYFNTVIVDKTTDKVIGAATLIVERKFIHSCANRGIIEEVIVSDQYRGKSLGKLIVKSLIELGKSLGCYKITLNCTDQMIPFYERLGFVGEVGNANFLVIRVPQN